MTTNYKKMLFEIANLDTDTQLLELQTRLKSWMGNYKQTDDILIIGLKIK